MKKALYYGIIIFCLVMSLYDYGATASERDVVGANGFTKALTGLSLGVKSGMDYIFQKADLYYTTSSEGMGEILWRWNRYMERRLTKDKA